MQIVDRTREFSHAHLEIMAGRPKMWVGGGNSREKNFDARIFSYGTFFLIHRRFVLESFGGKILRRSRMLACKAENCGGSHHSSQKLVISSCSQSFLPRPNHVNHFIWSLSGSLYGGLMEIGLVGRKKCAHGVEILPIWPWRLVKSANITTECAQQQ